MKTLVCKATPSDAEQLLDALPGSKYNEAIKHWGEDLRSLLFDSLYNSQVCYSIKADGKVVAMFGSAEVQPGVAVVWITSDNDLGKLEYRFVRHAIDYLPELMLDCDLLVGYFPDNNTRLEGFCEWLGFKTEHHPGMIEVKLTREGLNWALLRLR